MTDFFVDFMVPLIIFGLVVFFKLKEKTAMDNNAAKPKTPEPAFEPTATFEEVFPNIEENTTPPIVSELPKSPKKRIEHRIGSRAIEPTNKEEIVPSKEEKGPIARENRKDNKISFATKSEAKRALIHSEIFNRKY